MGEDAEMLEEDPHMCVPQPYVPLPCYLLLFVPNSLFVKSVDVSPKLLLFFLLIVNLNKSPDVQISFLNLSVH